MAPSFDHTHLPMRDPIGPIPVPVPFIPEGELPNGQVLEPIAVIGLSLKFPQDATSPAAFWQMLMEKRCATTEVPADRYNIDAFHGLDTGRTNQVRPRGGHFIKEDLTLFDAPFFSITSTEAASMDVQQRQLLECVYRALENAGLPIDKVDGSNTSVYTGSFADDYRLMTMRDHDSLPRYAATGSSISILANRVSWFYNLRGPSLQVDTACSSSLVALDLACQGLIMGEADTAIVAGSNTLLGMDTSLILSNMNFLSPDSRCWSFDHRGNGYARGEGFGVLVLKRMSDALRDGDVIRAVIRSTGSNSDGRTPGIAQPSGDAQEKLIRETYAKANLDPSVTRFFEAHGTGTAVGDPIEASAIGAVFGRHRSPDEPLYVGAVKSNVGHLEGASGVAGVIKTVLALERGIVPPNTNFEKLNPRIDAPMLGLAFPEQAVPWPCTGLRRASVNSFGFGGSNAHVVLDDAYHFLKSQGLAGFHNTVALPPRTAQLDTDTGAVVQSTNGTVSHPALLVWSTADEGGLKRISEAYNAHFKNLHNTHPAYLADLSYTLSHRRSLLPWRSYALAHSLSSLQTDGVVLSAPVRSSRNLGLCFAFTGQGAQFAGMGRELLVYPVFKNMLLRAQLYLYELGSTWSLMEELLRDRASSRVNHAELSQPLCTALQIALVELLRSFGVTPTAVVGHSSGEIAAAYCMGGLSLRSACAVAFFRGKLAARLASSSSSTTTTTTTTAPNKGAMLAVGLSENEAAAYIDQVASQSGSGRAEIVVACVNSPGSVTISGDEAQIQAMQRLVEGEGHFARRLQVEVAYHSPQMQAIAEEYARCMGQLELGRALPGCTTMISSVTTNRVGGVHELCDANYWVSNLVSPVRFSPALGRLVSTGQAKKLGRSANTNNPRIHDIVELGPHSALAGPIKQILKAAGSANSSEVKYASCLTRNVSALGTTLAVAGALWCAGYPVNLTTVNQIGATTKVQPRMPLTDLPEYPFDHSQSYWHESRVSKEYRQRRHAPLDLLGTPSKDWNPLEARWTKFIRTTETPWVADHVVNGATIYPAAGMLVMAIEGVRQLVLDSPSPRPIQGYRIPEATFQRALPVNTSSEAGTECQVYIRPEQDAMGKGSSRFEFRIYALEGGAWGENCRGLLQVEYEPAERNPVDGGVDEALSLTAGDWGKHAASCGNTVDVSAVYKHFADIGLHFGPTFQTLATVNFGTDGQVMADVNTFVWEADVAQHNPRQDHLVHPTTLDAFIQTVLVGLTRGAAELIPTTVPTRVTNLWLSSSGLAHPEATSLRVSSRQLSKGARQTESSLIVVDKTGALRASVGVLETTNVDRREATALESNGTPSRSLCYHMQWKPDIDLLPRAEGELYLGTGKAIDPQMADFYDTLASFQLLTISNTLRQLDPDRVDASRTAYIEWMKLQLERFKSNPPPASRSEWCSKIGDAEYYEGLMQRLSAVNTEGRFYVEVARNLLPILHGEVDPLQVLFSGDLVMQYYLEINDRLHEAFYKTLDLMAHKNPRLKVLEVGAGTGGTTAHVITPLFADADGTGNGTNRCEVYEYTDTSASFFEKAREVFAAHAARMRYSTLDIERDPLEQGFARGTYDVVIAANVLHATRNLDVTLQNVHALLRPGGKLILLEQTGDFARGGFAFGLLPGWWLSQDSYRANGPTMPPAQWDFVLKHSAFSGTDFVLNDYEGSVHQELSVIVSTALDRPRESMVSRPITSLLIVRGSEVQARIAAAIKQNISASLGFECEVHYLGSEDSTADRIVISLVELDQPLLHHLDDDTFTNIKSTLLRAKGLIWATAGGGSAKEAAEYHVADGLLRTLRTESPMLNAVTLALDTREGETTEAVHWITRVLDAVLAQQPAELEVEYRQHGGSLDINRVVPAYAMNEHIATSIKPQRSAVQPFGTPNIPPLALQVETPGQLDSLRFVEDRVAGLPLKPNEVEIQVEAVGVNFMDLLTALGRINQTEIGGECAGVITRVGDSSISSSMGLQPGDRVCAVAFDCFKTLARSDVHTVVRLPDSVSFTEAAALPVTYTTAQYALIVAGRLQEGDRVLIHAAAGGTGQAAVQIAQHHGAEVFATVGSRSKKEFLIEHYHIPEDHIFYSRDTSFAKGIMRATGNRGVDVVLNSLAGDGLASSWACMASFGRFVEIGKRDIHSHSRLNMFYFAKNVSFTAVDVFGMTKERPALAGKSFKAAMELVAAGHVKPPSPVQVYPVSQLEAALRHMQSGKSVGKLVVEMQRDASVQTLLDHKPTYHFDPNATYLIAGGFGGIARRTAQWMADRGAQHLLLLSRSGAKSAAAQALVESLQSRGVQIHAPPCDITSADALAAVLAECATTMPPIKGCIQGAMVLKDAVLDKMTYTDWAQALLPKVDGSRNLDRLLPRGLDFFIMLSSVVSIHGSAGQANYAAGGSYQDALARERVHRGEHAIVFNLGWMVSDGIIAESEFLTRAFQTAGLMMPIESSEYLALLDYYCDPAALDGTDPTACQIIVGLETPAGLAAKGADTPALLQRSTFRMLHAMGLDEQDANGVGAGGGDKGNAATKNWAAVFADAQNAAEARDVVVDGLLYKLSRALSIPATDIDTQRPLHSYGVDSLLAVELRSWLAKEFGAEVAVFEIMGATSFDGVASTVLSKSTAARKRWEQQ
ncbi:type I polyketide synthase [Aspergillus lucknowensis]|uniref:Polyketide synthase n=1 Tax=Aspergillus lucknowensis TaxID=176173 RepID=A0ABR4M4S1_9EURO